jgi:hypothetical protein
MRIAARLRLGTAFLLFLLGLFEGFELLGAVFSPARATDP